MSCYFQEMSGTLQGISALSYSYHLKSFILAHFLDVSCMRKFTILSSLATTCFWVAGTTRNSLDNLLDFTS